MDHRISSMAINKGKGRKKLIKSMVKVNNNIRIITDDLIDPVTKEPKITTTTGITTTKDSLPINRDNFRLEITVVPMGVTTQTQANAKAIANMEWQIAQMAEDQRKRDSGKLPSSTEMNPNHTQRAGKENVNAVETEWRKVTEENLVGKEGQIKTEESKGKIEEGGQIKEDKEVQKDEQPIVADINQKKEG
ncbi:hypothetical protein L1887_32051 [Cichorium endivia]|nr:hypothetical protein L1887_32051 [Cichorium endivia]